MPVPVGSGQCQWGNGEMRHRTRGRASACYYRILNVRVHGLLIRGTSLSRHETIRRHPQCTRPETAHPAEQPGGAIVQMNDESISSAERWTHGTHGYGPLSLSYSMRRVTSQQQSRLGQRDAGADAPRRSPPEGGKSGIRRDSVPQNLAFWRLCAGAWGGLSLYLYLP